MVTPTPVPSSTQAASAYTLLEATSLTTPYTEERTNSIVEDVSSVVTQNASTGVITVKSKITFQSYLNDALSGVSIAREANPNNFEAPIPLLLIKQVVGFQIYEVSQTYSKGTTGDFILLITGDNVPSNTVIANPFG